MPFTFSHSAIVLPLIFVGKDSVDVHEFNYEAIDEFVESIKAEFNQSKQKSDSCLVRC